MLRKWHEFKGIRLQGGPIQDLSGRTSALMHHFVSQLIDLLLVLLAELVGRRHIGRNEVNARLVETEEEMRIARQTIQLGDYPPADALSTLDGVEASKFAAARMGPPTPETRLGQGGLYPAAGVSSSFTDAKQDRHLRRLLRHHQEQDE
jgi:hypothetical protein